MSPTTPQEVMDTIFKLNDSTCLDIFNFNSRIIKEIADILAVPLHNLFNRCFVNGVFPDCLKISKVIPIFKKGDDSDPNNYRPISIIPVFGKICEILVKNRLTDYLEKNNILNEQQFGFRKSCSTSLALQQLLKNVVDNLEDGQHSALTLCDLTKAFDCVSHNLLLQKLYANGIRGVALDFFSSYLANRQQCVFINDSISDFVYNVHGVPQGSVLGPILFILYINDLCNFLDPQKCVLYADDTTLVTSNHNPQLLSQLSNSTLDKTKYWFTANTLSLNENKSQNLIISTNRSVVQGGYVKILGAFIDENLNWAIQVDRLCSKLASTIFVLRNLKPVLSLSHLRNTYMALFHSQLMYAIILWGNSSHAIKVFRLQKKIVRLMTSVGLKEPCRKLFQDFNILPLPCIYILETVLYIHKSKYLFVRNSEIHQYNTRSDTFRKKLFRYEISARNSINIDLYNHLPVSLTSLAYNKFKTKVKKHLVKYCFYSVQEFLDTIIILD